MFVKISFTKYGVVLPLLYFVLRIYELTFLGNSAILWTVANRKRNLQLTINTRFADNAESDLTKVIIC